MTHRVVICPGHSEDAQGAVRRVVGRDGHLHPSGLSEYRMHSRTAAHAAARLCAAGVDARVYHRSPTVPGYASKMRGLVERVERFGPACVVEIHYNAGPVGEEDTLALHWPGSAQGEALASCLTAHVAEALGTRDAGAVALRESGAGQPLYILRDTSCPAVILETHHVGDAKAHDLAALAATDGALGEAVARGILDWLEG